MKIWFRRIFALALLSMGIALAFLPFNDTRSGSINREVVYLEKRALLNPDEIGIQFPGEEIIDISISPLNQDDYPDLWRALIYLDTDWMNDSCDLSEWKRFQDTAFQGEKDFRLVAFRDALISCSVVYDENMAAFAYLGRYNTKIKELTKSDLKKYPNIIKSIENLNLDHDSLAELITIPKKDEWDKMVSRFLNPFEDLQTFKFEGSFYGPSFAWDTIWKTGTVSDLITILKVIGMVMILFGIFLISRLYFRKRGIMVNPKGVAIFYDIVTLLFGIAGAYMFANLVLSKTLFITPITDEEFILLMGTFFFCLGIPFVTIYTSRFTSQSILIDAKGIFVDSLITKGFISWDSLESISFSDEYVLVSRVGMPIPKQLQKSLKLLGKAGQQIVVNEPQLKSVKKKIIAKFEQNAPEDLKEKTMQVLNKW